MVPGLEAVAFQGYLNLGQPHVGSTGAMATPDPSKSDFQAMGMVTRIKVLGILWRQHDCVGISLNFLVYIYIYYIYILYIYYISIHDILT
jgi:hypothetical protein